MNVNKDIPTVKITLLGEEGVGKTSIIRQYIQRIFDDHIVSTNDAENICKTISLDNETQIRFDIWDTAGKEVYRPLAKIFFDDANVIIFVYDITKQKSFDELKNFWIQDV